MLDNSAIQLVDLLMAESATGRRHLLLEEVYCFWLELCKRGQNPRPRSQGFSLSTPLLKGRSMYV